MAKITKILHNGLYILPETVTDAVLDNKMERTLTEMLDDKLSATEEDTADKKITFKEGLKANGDGVTATKVTANKGDIKQVTADKITSESIESADYISGLSGYKLGIVGAESYLDIDKLIVRKKAIFTELDIKRIDHIGGANVTSPASCRIAKVEPYYPSTTMTTAEGDELSAADGDYSVLAANSVGYKCYFQAEQDGEQINNDWRVGDQALCHAYNLATPRYYWRLVIDKSTAIEDGYHWVALSITDCDTDSDVPMAEDTIVCFGNRTDADRQSVIIMDSEGASAPYLRQLKGINSYTISDANIVTQLSPTKNIIKGNQIILMSESGDKNIGDEIKSTKAALSVQADKISSVVSKQEAMVVDYTFADFIQCGYESGWWDDSNDIRPIGYEKVNNGCLLLIIPGAKKGDVIRVEPNMTTGNYAFYDIVGGDGDVQLAEQMAMNYDSSQAGNFNWYGIATTQWHYFDSIPKGQVTETLIEADSYEVFVFLTDDWSDRSKIKVSHIKAKMTAQSRIDQSADNIRLQVGQAGINLDTKVITLDASKTIVTGDLAVRTVKCYYDAAQTQLKSAYNGNGDGTIVYYYPTGKVMKEDTFVTDASGNVIGMKTTYYKADGSVAWVISEGGLSMTLDDYWVPIAGGKEVAYTTDVDAMMSVCVEYTADAMAHFTERSVFSKFVSKSVNYAKYNGKVTKGFRTSEAPTAVALFAGVLVYSVELYKDGLLPTYIVTYERVTTAQNQVGAIMTQKFNISGEVN